MTNEGGGTGTGGVGFGFFVSVHRMHTQLSGMGMATAWDNGLIRAPYFEPGATATAASSPANRSHCRSTSGSIVSSVSSISSSNSSNSTTTKKQKRQRKQWQTIPSHHLRVGRVIGKGAYGMVCQGTFHGNPVAIKELDRSLMGIVMVDAGARMRVRVLCT